MKHGLKKVLSTTVLGLAITGLVSSTAFADGYHHHHERHGNSNALAAGLVMGGVMGMLAGSAMASNSQPQPQPNYYPEDYDSDYGPYCYKVKLGSHRFCDEDGCYVKTAWKTVCR